MRLVARLLLILCLAAGAAALPAPGAFAQNGTAVAIDYDAWEAVAQRAEEALAAGRASTAALEDLRGEIVTWRERLLAAQDVNAARIETLRRQIDALGPVPEEGATEAEEIADRRRSLNEQLAQAQAPVRAAEEAFRRADGIVRQIDALIRLRQTDELLSLGPSPANPALWPGAAQAFAGSVAAMIAEAQNNWASEATRAQFRQSLPQTLLFVLIAGVLVIRGRPTMVMLTQTVLDRSKGRARWLAAFLTSLFQVVLPVLGIWLLSAALISTGMPGLRGQTLLRALPYFGLFVFGARWIGLRLYPLHPDAPRPMAGTFDSARVMRFYITALGLLLGGLALLDQLVEFENYSAGTEAVLYFPFYIVLGLVYVQLGWILSRHVTEDEDQTFAQRGQRLVGQGLLLLGVLAPLSALIGYRNAAHHMVVPLALSLALLGVLRVLHDIVVELFAVLTRRSNEAASEALTPTVISFSLVLASLPLFALIWGARITDLTEIWAMFRDGFVIGDIEISPATFLVFAAVFAILFAATRLFQAALKSTILPKTKIDPGGQNAIVSGIGYAGIGLGAVIAVTTAGIDLSALAFVFGALSVGIGFGLQNIVSNFISGIILLIERPVAEGDWIEVGGHMGTVKDIAVRSTRIETFDRNDVIIPNADFISGAVKNWTRGNHVGRIIVGVRVAHGTDTRRVEKILLDIAMNHPLVALEPEPAVDFLEFGPSSLDFQIRMVLPDINYGFPVRTEIRHQIAERFAAEGIEIPFAQSDIWLRNPEALHTAAAPAEAAPSSAATPDGARKVRGEDLEANPDDGDGED